MSSHTKGPWYSWDNGLGLIGVGKQHGNEADLFHAVGESNRDRSEDLANANLIAAAPDLLHALEVLVRINVEHNEAIAAITGAPMGWKDLYLDAARTAIARAKGEK